MIKYKNNYIATEEGDIYKISFKGTKKLKQTKKKNGYMVVGINGKIEYVHRIVIEFFKGKNKLQVDHIDGDKTNNKLSNLEYVTPKENINRYLNKTGKKNGRKPKRIIWNEIEFNSIEELSKNINVKKNTIYQSIRRKSKIKNFEAKYIE